MSIGYLGCSFHLFLCGSFHSEGYIVEDGVVEEDGLLVDIAYDASERVDAEVAHVCAVDADGPRGDIVVAGDKVDEGALARS